MDANFSNAMLAGSDFTNANLLKADLRGAQGITVEQLSTARSLEKALLDPTIEAELRLRYPQLFETEEAVKPTVKLA